MSGVAGDVGEAGSQVQSVGLLGADPRVLVGASSCFVACWCDAAFLASGVRECGVVDAALLAPSASTVISDSGLVDMLGLQVLDQALGVDGIAGDGAKSVGVLAGDVAGDGRGQCLRRVHAGGCEGAELAGRESGHGAEFAACGAVVGAWASRASGSSRLVWGEGITRLVR